MVRAVLILEADCVRRAAAVVTGVLSLAVTLAEVTVSPGLPNLSVFAAALHAMPTHETSTELLAFAFLVRPTPGPVTLSLLMLCCLC